MDIGIAERPKAGNFKGGDAHLFVEDGGRIVLALADGLGSGEKAARSARLAVQSVVEYPQAALNDILAYAHYAILAAGGVGAMMVILRLDPSRRTLEFSGVGNISFQAHSRRTIQPFSRYGYLGLRLPTLHVFRFDYDPGDAFVLHTDGISSRFHLSNHLADLAQGAQHLAECALAEYGKDHDDATIIVVRT